MELRRLTSVEDVHYAEAMALYAQSFPYHEQREPDAQAAVMADPAYHFDLILEEGRLAGVILNWQTESFIYVEHFCIMPDLRGRGYGRRALALLAALGRTVILEIDPPTDAVAIRRRHFYETAGYTENPYAHIHPPYHSGYAGHALVVMSGPQAIGETLYRTFSDYLHLTVMKDRRG